MSTLAQNQFSIVPVAGSKISGSNVSTCEFYSATATDTISAGEAVILASTLNGQRTKVSAGTGAASLYFGVVATNPLKQVFSVGDLLEVIGETAIVMMTVSAAVTAGDKLQYDYAAAKVATQTGSNTVVGIAMKNATADGDLIPVYVKPGWTSNGEANTASSAGTGSDGVPLTLAKSGVNLPFKRIKAGSGCTITEQTNGITISVP